MGMCREQHYSLSILHMEMAIVGPTGRVTEALLLARSGRVCMKCCGKDLMQNS